MYNDVNLIGARHRKEVKMKAFTGFASAILAILGAVAAVGIYLKKKTEKEAEFEEFDNVIESDEDFDEFFDEDEDIEGDSVVVTDEAAQAEEATEKADAE